MPPLPPIDGVIRIVPRFTLNGGEAYNVIHYSTLAPITTEMMAELGNDWITKWKAQARVDLSNDCCLADVTVMDMSSNPVGTVALAPGTGQCGNRITGALPANVALVVSLRTGRRGRSFRGRIYLAGLGEAVVIGNAVDEAARLNFQNGWTTLMELNGALTASAAVLTVVSYFADGAVRAQPLATTVESILVNNRVDTQRRRLNRR